VDSLSLQRRVLMLVCRSELGSGSRWATMVTRDIMGITRTDTIGRTTDRIRTMPPITRGLHSTGPAGIGITATPAGTAIIATIVIIVNTVIGIKLA
jgi:hypothetical protein